MSYDPKYVESKWQDYWQQQNSFKTTEDPNKPKYYVLDMFPYPSGSGLHVGHPEGYTASDIIARYKRMKGFSVLHPMGWDAFGLPAERAAIRDNRHPRDITKENITNFKKQITKLGFSYDWEREINTSEPDYYKWTQWLFLQLYKKDLAYLAEIPVNWCPAQGTVLSNEEVQDGKYVETGDLVERKLMRQWVLKITKYAKRLIDDLDELDWPESVKSMQKEWIGESIGAEITFTGAKSNLKVFTTRPDTLYGVSSIVLSPEHPNLSDFVIDLSKVNSFIEELKNKSDLEQEIDAAKEKSGVFTGSYVQHPLTGKQLPVWIGNYVKADYGTGAVMSVPAHDQRDFEFAQKYKLDIIPVIDGFNGEEAFTEHGITQNSAEFDGKPSIEVAKLIINKLESLNVGKKKVTYKLRDWLFSRQRYWGEPFPILLDQNKDPVVLTEGELPVLLPEITEYKPTADGMPPLARDLNWLHVKLDGSKYTRETNTMPQWAGSCWYYLRFMDPNNHKQAFSKEKENYWGQVDLYIGGVEHAVLHLLYARFWHKVFYDCGLVSTKEPFQKLFNQGMILGESYKDQNGKYYHIKDVVTQDNSHYTKNGIKLEKNIEKMSKSKLNVVDPLDIIEIYGADSLRLYEMFMGPLEQVKPWQTSGVKGVNKFLHKVWDLFVSEDGSIRDRVKSTTSLEKNDLILHQTIEKVTADIEGLKFNTAISKMMELINTWSKSPELAAEQGRTFILLLSPFAPHICEELWQLYGSNESLTNATWPQADPSKLVVAKILLPVQINGKVRAKIEVDPELPEQEIFEIAISDQKVKKYLDAEIKKTIYVKSRILNIIL